MQTVGQSGANPFDALLAGYAAGALPRPLHALVSAHLEISPRNRGYVALLEGAAAETMTHADPVAVRKRAAMLDSIFAQSAAPAIVRPHDAVSVMPNSLRDYLGHDLGAVPWRKVLPGVKEFRLGNGRDEEATLYWIRAGKRMPSHTHDGSEVTLVLQGGFTDPTGHYARGDVAVADAELDHHPVADDDIDCICFAVTDAPLRLTGPIGRIFQRFFGH